MRALTLILLPVIIISCSATSTLESKINKSFLDDYGDEVKEIIKERDAYQEQIKKEKKKQKQSSKSVSLDVSNTNLDPWSLPSDMFEVTYNSTNYPDSYKSAGVNFDDIIIPNQDSHGINTTLEEKSYNMVSNQILQKNLDYIHSIQETHDLEIDSILIREQKEAKQREALNILDLNKAPNHLKAGPAELKKPDDETRSNSKKSSGGIIDAIGGFIKKIIKLGK